MATTTVSSTTTTTAATTIHHAFNPLTDEDEVLIKPLFDYIDSDRDGRISISQARALFSHLGYPPEKADFKTTSTTGSTSSGNGGGSNDPNSNNNNIKFDEFVFFTNGKKSTGALGRDDLDTNAHRAFRMAASSNLTPGGGCPTVIDVPTFNKFLQSLGIEADPEICENVHDLICAHQRTPLLLQPRPTPTVLEQEEEAEEGPDSSGGRKMSIEGDIRQGGEEVGGAVATMSSASRGREGFNEKTWVEYITTTFPKARRSSTTATTIYSSSSVSSSSRYTTPPNGRS